jgi:glucokinase
LLLAGDVGATHVRLALFSKEEGLRKSVFENVYLVKSFESLHDILKTFRRENKTNVTAVSFSAAEPVKNDRIVVTKISWEINRELLSRFFKGIPVNLINDLEGLSNIIPVLSHDQIEVVNKGEKTPRAPIVVLAPGTGFGEAYLIWNGTRYQSFPSEGGHSDFAPLDNIQIQLFNYLQEKYGHVSYERVCSGNAILDIYDFFIPSIMLKNQNG